MTLNTQVKFERQGNKTDKEKKEGEGEWIVVQKRVGYALCCAISS